MRQSVKKEDKPERKKIPAYLKITSAILVVSTTLTIATCRQRQKIYDELAILVEIYCESVDRYCESVDRYCESSERVISSNEKLKQSIDALKELDQ